MKLVVFSVFSILAFSMACFAQNEKPKLSDVDQIRLRVFQELLKPWLPKPRRDQSPYLAKAFYFQIEDEKDPSKELIGALGEGRVPFRAASRSYISDPDGGIVLDKKTGERGILFTIYKLKWKDRDEAVVSAGNHEGNMSAFSCDYSVKRQDSVWQLVAAANCVIS